MSSYEQLRHFADSWGLVFLFAVFLIAVLRALLASRHAIDAAATIPMRDEEPGK